VSNDIKRYCYSKNQVNFVLCPCISGKIDIFFPKLSEFAFDFIYFDIAIKYLCPKGYEPYVKQERRLEIMLIF
jgi:hypothetical protein